MNLSEILTERGIDHRIGPGKNVRKNWIGVDCFLCSPQSGKYLLGLSTQGRPHAVCWVCGRIRWREVAKHYDLPWIESDGVLEPQNRSEHTGKLRIPHTEPMLPPHRRYLQSRGFDDKKLEKIWDLRGIGISSELSWRIWIPVYFNGKVVSWTTRTIGNRDPKYLAAHPKDEDMPIKSTLYGWDYVRTKVIVTEGPADAWRVGPGAVSTFGVHISDEQVRLLSTVPYRLICFDSDAAGRKRAADLAGRLEYISGVTEVATLDAADPGSADEREIAELRRWLE